MTKTIKHFDMSTIFFIFGGFISFSSLIIGIKLGKNTKECYVYFLGIFSFFALIVGGLGNPLPHECAFTNCPMYGLTEFKTDCYPGTDCYLIDSLHWVNPELSYNDLEDSLFLTTK